MGGPEPLVVGLDLRGRRCVVVGAGGAGLRRARTLAASGADVTVVAEVVPPGSDSPAGLRQDAEPDFELELDPPERPGGGSSAALPVSGVEIHRFRPEDLDGAWLVASATGDPASEAEVAEAAEARQCWWVSASREGSWLSLLARRELGDGAWLAVGTGSESPALAAWLADRLVEALTRAEAPGAPAPGETDGLSGGCAL